MRVLSFPTGSRFNRPRPLSDLQRLAGELERRRPTMAAVIERLVIGMIQERDTVNIHDGEGRSEQFHSEHGARVVPGCLGSSADQVHAGERGRRISLGTKFSSGLKNRLKG